MTIGYTIENGFILPGAFINIDPDVAWEMWHEGIAELTKRARKQLKLEVEKKK